MQIRQAHGGDAALLCELGRRAFVAAFAHLNDPTEFAKYVDDAFTEERLAAELAEPATVFFILHGDGAAAPPLGYVKLRDCRVPDCLAGQEGVLELERIYVAPGRVGGGLGGRLMAHALEWAAAQGYRVMWLGVWEKNPEAQNFYRKWGFTERGDKTFAVGDDVQRDLVMVREMNR